jgi:hypothetical protein
LGVVADLHRDLSRRALYRQLTTIAAEPLVRLGHDGGDRL